MKNQYRQWLFPAIALVELVIIIVLAVTHNSGSTNTVATSSNKPASTALVKNNVFQERPSQAVGKYLTDPKNKTLYTYDKDGNNVSNCDSTCIKTWPPYGPTASGSLPANLTVIKRSDGTSQFAYKGHPLYYYFGDKLPGDVLGNGADGFHVATY